MTNTIINGMSSQPVTTKETITQYSHVDYEDESSNIPDLELLEDVFISDEELNNEDKYLDKTMLGHLEIDTTHMRTHRLPEDDEGMTVENQKPSRMPKALLDALNGVTEEHPEGVRQLVHVRLHNNLIDKLKAYGSTINLGHQALIVEILEDFIKTKNL